MLENNFINKRIEQNNQFILTELGKRVKNVKPNWRIKIPFCNKIIVAQWLQQDDGVTKYGQQCNLNFDDDGYFFDSGVATADKKLPEWYWDDRLNDGSPLKFQYNGKWLRYGGIRQKRIKDSIIEEIEITGHWTHKINGHWKRVGSSK